MDRDRTTPRLLVSIHAPVRGATRRPHRTSAHCGFNPRTREGCDMAGKKLRTDRQSFNPRTREGCDLLAPGGAVSVTVSIHAPVRGAT